MTDVNDQEPRPPATAVDEPARAGMPRWVKVSLIVVAALVLVFVIAKVTGAGGDHGPGRHGGDDDAPLTVLDEDGEHRPPVDHGP